MAGVDTTGDSSIDDGYIFNIQEDLYAKCRSPWAVGLGAEQEFDRPINFSVLYNADNGPGIE